MTDNIGELALALSKAQGEITGALKDSENPFFKSNYADLGNVLAACREPLSKNELAVIQTTEERETGVLVITTLIHSSGQWIRGRLLMHPTKPDPQGVGSALTYARRYAYAAIVGVAQVDDDANAASTGTPEKPRISDNQALTLEAKITENGLDMVKFLAWLKRSLKVDSIADITKEALPNVQRQVKASIEAHTREPGEDG